MKNSNIYAGFRYPVQIISHAVWLYHRFTLSFRDIEELLAARGITVSYETIRQWCRKHGARYCKQIKKNRGALGATWYLDEVFIKINVVLHYLWRAVDQGGDEIDILVQKRKDKKVAVRFFKTLMGIVILTAIFSSARSWGQADPSWLKSWNEAYESRPATIESKSRIASKSEAGTPLIIYGQVFTPDGTLASGVLVHAYHRDHNGLEFGPNDNSLTTWALQGWAKTDASGRFEFRTIRPSPDHLGREGAHVHFTIESADFGRQWAPKVFFADDPLIPVHQHRRSKQAGEFAWIREVRIEDGEHHVDVKIQLKEKADF